MELPHASDSRSRLFADPSSSVQPKAAVDEDRNDMGPAAQVSVIRVGAVVCPAL